MPAPPPPPPRRTARDPRSQSALAIGSLMSGGGIPEGWRPGSGEGLLLGVMVVAVLLALVLFTLAGVLAAMA